MNVFLPFFLPAFFASIVEFVEALTIVLAIGVSVNWKSSLWGAAAGTAVLAVLVAVFGTTLVLFVPLEVLRLVIGVILVLFGLQWIMKSLLRYAGHKALHDEAAIYERELAEARSRGQVDRRFNPFGFATSFKSVLLEGLEVAFIVLTFGAGHTDKLVGIGVAALGALAALVLVLILGIAVRKPLTKVPENTLKFVVGLMLVTFGTFWAGEGLGLEWPGADLFLFALFALYLVVSLGAVAWLKTRSPRAAGPGMEALKGPIRWLAEIFDFFCGDWWVFAGMIVTLAVLSLPLTLRPVIWVAGILASLALALWRRTTRRNIAIPTVEA